MEDILNLSIKLNKHQTSLDDPVIIKLPREVQQNILTYLDEVEFISNLASDKMLKVSDMPKDSDGKIILFSRDEDENIIHNYLTNPHELVNMDYFRDSALHFKKHGKYTLTTPNPHPKSPYKLFWKEEIKRCREGYSRDDGEWIPGVLYFYWNYCPILLSREIVGTKKANRVQDFPDPWLGDYLFFHYMNAARDLGEHIAMIKCRGVGSSFKMGVLGPHRSLFFKKQKTFYVAYEKEYLTKDGVLNKAWDYMDFIAQNTPWPRMRITDTLNKMVLKLGYKDLADGTEKGTLGEIIGISTRDDPDKPRGKRGTIMFEEFGKYPRITDTWNICRPSVEDGDFAFDQLYASGTGGSEGADFSGAEDMMYHPETYKITGLPNVFDKGSPAGSVIFHWGSYLARKGCMNKDGMPDVVKALKEVCSEFYKIKMSSSDSKALTQRKAELAITIQDAIMRTEGTLFPVGELKDYLEEFSANHKKAQSTHYIGDLYLKNKEVIWKPDITKYPISKFPFKPEHANEKEGAIELFEMPKRNSLGEIDPLRYISGIDPVDDDEAKYSVSLTSIFIFDTFTDRVVAEYTGRPKYADDFYEICRKMLIFYNAKANYEQNKKGLFSYFSTHHSLYLLCDTPEILRDNDMAGAKGYGNKSKGSNATAVINQWARRLIAQWLIKPSREEDPELTEKENASIEPNLRLIRSKALLEELIKWNGEINCDRVSALGMVMIYREERLKNLISAKKGDNKGYSPKADDPYFNKQF